MGKHDCPTPMNEVLEQHYKDEIKSLNEKMEESKSLLKEAQITMERLRFIIDQKDAEIEVLRKSLIDTIIEKTEERHGISK